MPKKVEEETKEESKEESKATNDDEIPRTYYAIIKFQKETLA